MIAALAALFLGAAQPAAPACNWRNAVPADLRVLAAAPAQWLDRCVRLEGMVQRNVFYSDVAGLYAAFATNKDDRRNDGWLGLYRDAPRFYGALRRGSIIGIVQDCAVQYERAMAQAAPGELLMSTGYCHYRGGLVLADSQFRAGSRVRPMRQTGEAARLAFGDLQTEAEVGPAPDAVRRLGDRFIAAVRAGDAAALRSFAGPWSEQTHWDRPRWARAYSAWLAGHGGSPLAALRRNAAAPQTVYLRERVERDAAAEGETGDWHICYCKTGDCNGVWPISASDATAEAPRPFVCARAYNDRQRRSEPPDRLGLERSGGLREPPPAVIRRASNRIRR